VHYELISALLNLNNFIMFLAFCRICTVMAHLINQSVCTSRPPTYLPVSDIANSVSGQCSDIIITPASCGIEMMSCENSISSAAVVGRLQHPKMDSSRSPVSSILYNLLNVRAQKSDSSISSSSSAALDNQMEGMTDLTECRNRSDSLGSAVCVKLGVISRTPSGGSLASSNGYADRDANWNQSEELIEDARTRLVQLSTNTDATLCTGDFESRSHSQPGTPPSPAPMYVEQRRKYSVGSRLAQLSQQQSLGDPYVPVDLSCKRSRYCGSERGLNSTTDSDDSSCSILKSVLSVSAPGVRRNTVSVCSQRGLLTARRRHVTLAKKAFFPVSARITEQLKRVVKFATSLPEFCSLPVNDQLALLTSACPRLLLLYMAEVNLQFAVTSMHESGSAPTTLSDCYDRVPSPAESDMLSSSMEWPTMQFVENTQSFIRKCQQLQIKQNEYFYMRMITLFHTGWLHLHFVQY
jgi:Ligand-binding domain of nuclear hormone receptor